MARYNVLLSNDRRLLIEECDDSLRIASMNFNTDKEKWVVGHWICEMDLDGIQAFERAHIGCRDLSLGLRHEDIKF